MKIYDELNTCVSRLNALIADDDVIAVEQEQVSAINAEIDSLCERISDRLCAMTVLDDEAKDLIDALAAATFGIALESPRPHRQYLYTQALWHLLDLSALSIPPFLLRHRALLLSTLAPRERKKVAEVL